MGCSRRKSSFPRAGRRFPPRESAYVEQVLERIGSQWNPATGVIARGGVSFYREGRVDKEDVNQSDPDIAFYITANPGQAEGDSLVCLAPLTLRNFAYIAKRQFLRGRKKKSSGAANADGQRNLGVLYMRGWGVPRDNVTAYAWLLQSSSQGNRRARVYLDTVEHSITPNQTMQARKWIADQLQLPGEPHPAVTDDRAQP